MSHSLRRIGLHLAGLDIKAATINFGIHFFFILPILVLYLLHPDSFQVVWKGRAPYIIFLWFFFLEYLLIWKRRSKDKLEVVKWTKVLVATSVAAVPTIYIIAVFVFGLNHNILEIGQLLGAGRHGSSFLQNHWLLSFEYLVFAVFFTTSIQLMYGIDGVKRFSISLFFLGATGSFYMIDTFYPYESFTPLQALVPFTVSSAASILHWMGYELQFRAPFLVIPGSGIKYFVAIYWPCAGIHSLIIYAFTIILFIKEATLSLKWKISAITIGAAGTLVVNALRIASICVVTIETGPDAAQVFHSYYGELYFVAWIITYLMILVFWTRTIWPKLLMLRGKPA